MHCDLEDPSSAPKSPQSVMKPQVGQDSDMVRPITNLFCCSLVVVHAVPAGLIACAHPPVVVAAVDEDHRVGLVIAITLLPVVAVP